MTFMAILLLVLLVLCLGGKQQRAIDVKERNTASSHPCPKNAFCFLNDAFCHPGYDGIHCKERLAIANPWYTRYCPNLHGQTTFHIDIPLHQIGGEFTKFNSSLHREDSHPVLKYCGPNLKACAYLCYSHPAYGTGAVPRALWEQAQIAEAALWTSLRLSPITNDRAAEHWAAFDNFQVLLSNQAYRQLGRVIEVGAGPWTQLKGMLYIRPELSVEEFTIWEPSAESYMANIPSCAYRNGKALSQWDGPGFLYHTFPIHIQSSGGELLSSLNQKQYDTLISINVLEHTQDAFQYLSSLYLSLRAGGLLIWHERYYDDKTVLDGDRFHPIRVKKVLLDRFLSHFEVLFNNATANYDGRPNEKGYYVIAIKK